MKGYHHPTILQELNQGLLHAYSRTTKPITRKATRASSGFSGDCFFMIMRSKKSTGLSAGASGKLAARTSSARKGKLCKTRAMLAIEPVNSSRKGISVNKLEA